MLHIQHLLSRLSSLYGSSEAETEAPVFWIILPQKAMQAPTFLVFGRSLKTHMGLAENYATLGLLSAPKVLPTH